MASKKLLDRLPAKIRCENWHYSRRVQIHLEEKIGCSWGLKSIKIPWLPRSKLLLVVQKGWNEKWFFSWGTSADFDSCPYPEISGKELLALETEEVLSERA